MELWYWHKPNDQKARGPISKNELMELISNGELTFTDKVWKEGIDDWLIASKVNGLFPEPPPIYPENAKKRNRSIQSLNSVKPIDISTKANMYIFNEGLNNFERIWRWIIFIPTGLVCSLLILILASSILSNTFGFDTETFFIQIILKIISGYTFVIVGTAVLQNIDEKKGGKIILSIVVIITVTLSTIDLLEGNHLTSLSHLAEILGAGIAYLSIEDQSILDESNQDDYIKN